MALRTKRSGDNKTNALAQKIFDNNDKKALPL
jgi:hypothetical protein